MNDPFLDYPLPPELIAQQPCDERDQSRLLVANRSTGALAHRTFADLPYLLNPNDLLILNDTRVLPARLLGHRTKTGGKWQGLFLRQRPDRLWELLCQTRGRLMEGESIEVNGGSLHLELRTNTPDGHWLAWPREPGSAIELLQRHGQVPLPPYIRKGQGEEPDRDRYQTIYARQAGAVAAPTAGLHFTPAVFDRLRQRGIDWSFVTLHVGAGTFQPIQTDDFRRHRMHAEWAELPAESAKAIAAGRKRGGRIVAVGTTSVRVLETVAASGPIRPWSGETELYIYPPYPFKIVDGLVTNFHLPRSTLLLLAEAFAGVELLEKAYRTAIEQRYRFYSYGDAMLMV